MGPALVFALHYPAAMNNLTELDIASLDTINGGVDWGHVANTAKAGSDHVGAAGAAVGGVAGGVIGAGGGAVAIPGIGSVPGWAAGTAAGAGLGYGIGRTAGYIGGAAKGIWDTWGK